MTEIEYHIQNAQISKATLGFQRDGVFLGFSIMLEYGSGGAQNFGGWSFDEPIKDANGKFLRREPTGPEFGLMVTGILRAMEVDHWHRLHGKICRVKRTGQVDDYHSRVFAIGHPIEDKWFDIRDLVGKV